MSPNTPTHPPTHTHTHTHTRTRKHRTHACTYAGTHTHEKKTFKADKLDSTNAFEKIRRAEEEEEEEEGGGGGERERERGGGDTDVYNWIIRSSQRWLHDLRRINTQATSHLRPAASDVQRHAPLNYDVPPLLLSTSLQFLFHFTRGRPGVRNCPHTPWPDFGSLQAQRGWDRNERSACSPGRPHHVTQDVHLSIIKWP